MNIKTPILYCGYNRLNVTKKSINILKKIKTKKIYICLDGPKENHDDEMKINKIKKFLKSTKFSSKVIFKFRKKNLGCKHSIANALSWFFHNEKFGIILEDDILPSYDFFKFCEYGLNKYKKSNKISMICGTNYLGSKKISNEYFYSKHFLIWGWATWKHVWKKYDVNMKDWKLKKVRSRIKKEFSNEEYQFLSNRFDQLTLNYKDTWDIQWYFMCIKNKYLSVMPVSNLITNIGVVGTHSKKFYKTLFLKSGKIDIQNLIYPKKIIQNKKFDLKLHREFNFKKNFIQKIYYKIKNYIHEFL